jgi:uncharacterized protein YdhG (YjbR/CyaY superfamily)
MQYDVKTIEEYIEAVGEERKAFFKKLIETIESSLPSTFEKQLSYGMVGFVVPLSIYPKGYHAKKGEPLPFISVANQKNHFAIYHNGLYMNQELRSWFVKEYKERVKTKLDMSKSCIRLKYFNELPYELINDLCNKMSAEEFIDLYEKSRK